MAYGTENWHSNALDMLLSKARHRLGTYKPDSATRVFMCVRTLETLGADHRVGTAKLLVAV